LFDGQHRKANWTLEEAAGPQAITTEKTSVASRAFEQKQIAVDRASAKNLLQHIVSPLQALIGMIEPIKSRFGNPRPNHCRHHVRTRLKCHGCGTDNRRLIARKGGVGPKYQWLLDESTMARRREPAEVPS
jgi:hypothetical protein